MKQNTTHDLKLRSLKCAVMTSVPHSPSQLEQNAQSRSPGIHPIILWTQEEAEKAKAAAASAPVDVKAMMSKVDRKK